MAAADPPAGLMDIASTLSQDDIPFKLRCAICNKLAVNAFRLPCCDQSICETCQTSLPDTCSVCAHTPVSPDLCKPNKALRTTLKAFLRTEEKKREKERQSAAATPVITTPAENDPTPAEAVAEQKQVEEVPAEVSESTAPAEVKPVEAPNEEPAVDAAVDTAAPESTEPVAEPETNGHVETKGDEAADATVDPTTEADAQPTTNGDAPAEDESAAQDPSQQSDANMVNVGPGGFSGMGGWNGNNNFNGMNPYMANPMFNFPNGMGMPMTMDPMAANQGMFGEYGMNMTGMGMNMGMNFNGQGMYGSLGWDGSQQNMWQGGQDKFNPNAFANGTGPPYGGAFGGSNMSYPSNSDYQSGYYGPGYGRGGGYRGRGRGYYQGGPGRGGYGGSGQGHFPPNGNSGYSNGQPGPGASVEADGTPGNTEEPSQMNKTAGTDPVSNGHPQTGDGAGDTATEPSAQDNQGQQLQGIPTIDSLDQASGQMEHNGYQNHMAQGYGRGGYMRGGFSGGRGGYWGGMPGSYQPQMERTPGVEGAPAAPRAMRQGLPNTSVFRQRAFHVHGKASVGSNTPATSQRGNSEAPQDAPRTRSPSRAPSQAQGAASRSRSPSQGRASRARSPPDDNRDSYREADSKRPDTVQELKQADRRSRSPSRMSSRRSSRRRDRDEDRDRRSGHRSHRSRRHHSRSDSRSRSRSPARKGDSRHPDRLKQITEENEPNGHGKVASETGDRRGDLASRISNGHRSGRDGHSRREEDRERERDRDRDRARDGRRRERDRNQDGCGERDRDSERDRRQNRDRERERDHGGEKERDRRDRGNNDRERERKRRRGRSESPNTNERSSQPQSRRVKTNGEDRKRDHTRAQTAKPESEKDPYTLEREARNRERLLREQQNRGSAKSSTSKSSHRRDSRQERLVGGRRINYKYEDEL